MRLCLKLLALIAAILIGGCAQPAHLQSTIPPAIPTTEPTQTFTPSPTSTPLPTHTLLPTDTPPPTLTPTPAPTPLGGGNGQLAIVQGDKIRFIQPPSKVLGALSAGSDGNWLGSLSWSPDGQYLTCLRFSKRGNDKAYHFYGMNLVDAENKTDQPLLDENYKIWSYQWSPESSRLAVNTTEGLVIVGLNKEILARLDGFSDHYPVEASRKEYRQPVAAFDWSPKGDRLVLAAVLKEDLKKVGLFIFDPATQTATRLGEQVFNEGAGIFRNFNWLPDGKTLTFIYESRGRRYFYNFDLETQKVVRPFETSQWILGQLPGGNLVTLGGSKVEAEKPGSNEKRTIAELKANEQLTDYRWSPDEKHIALVMTGRAGRQVYHLLIAHLDGSPATEIDSDVSRLGRIGLIIQGVTWSPDSQYIAFADLIDKANTVLIAHALTGEIQVIQKNLEFDPILAWQP